MSANKKPNRTELERLLTLIAEEREAGMRDNQIKGALLGEFVQKLAARVDPRIDAIHQGAPYDVPGPAEFVRWTEELALALGFALDQVASQSPDGRVEGPMVMLMRLLHLLVAFTFEYLDVPDELRDALQSIILSSYLFTDIEATAAVVAGVDDIADDAGSMTTH